MADFKRITCFENTKRRTELERFVALAKSFEANEEDGVRSELNRIIHRISYISQMAQVSTIIQYTDPPLVGGRSYSVDIIQNMFNLDGFAISKRRILDVAERAIGVYLNDYTRSKIRTFNPLWWVWRLFQLGANAPFALVGSAGFDSRAIAQSTVGRAIKALILATETAAALATVAAYLNYKL